MESNHLVQDDHRVTAGYLAVRSHSRCVGNSCLETSEGANAKSPPEVLPRAGLPFPGCLVNQLGYEALPRIGLLAHTFGRKAGAAIADGLMPIVVDPTDPGAYLS